MILQNKDSGKIIETNDINLDLKQVRIDNVVYNLSYFIEISNLERIENE